MDVIKIVVLALLQGIAEFLPISSSGHLVLGKSLLGLTTPMGALFEVVLHAGTLLSICLYFRRRLVDLAWDLLRGRGPAWRFALKIFLACLPAVVVYGLFGDSLERLFDKPASAAGLLCVTGVVLLSLRWAPSPSRDAGVWRVLAMGMAQAAALLPGISRSGSTIATGRWLGLKPEEAAEVSFLMVLPLLVGAVLVEVPSFLHEISEPVLGLGPLSLGFVVAAVSGYGALAVLMKTLSGRHFHWFGFYCLGAGSAALLAVATGVL